MATRKKVCKLTDEDIRTKGELHRTKCRTKLYDAIQQRAIISHDELTERARKIEASIYNHTIRSITHAIKMTRKKKNFPKKIVFGVFGNKKDTKDYGEPKIERTIKVPQFKKAKKYRIKANWDCYIFCSRYSNKTVNVISNIKDERNPGFIQSIIDKTIPLRELANLKADEIFPELWKPIKEKVWAKEVILGVISDVSDGIAQCGKCKSMKTTYYSLQTRSADEPMTNFFTCHNCGKHWKT